MHGDGDRRVTLAELRIDIVILACAVSAGIHGALVAGSLRRGHGRRARLRRATVLLAALAVALTRKPTQLASARRGGRSFAGLIVSYALAITTGVPVLHPEVEAVDGLALFTKAVEARRPARRGEPRAAARRSPSPHDNRKEH